MWSTQIMVLGHENQARKGPILPAGFVFLSYCEPSSANVTGTSWLVNCSHGAASGTAQQLLVERIQVGHGAFDTEVAFYTLAS